MCDLKVAFKVKVQWQNAAKDERTIVRTVISTGLRSVCWLVSRITQKLMSEFPRTSDGGWAQNSINKVLVYS